MFKIENFNEGEVVHRSKIIYPPKNRVKGSDEDREDQVECNFEEKKSKA